MPTQETLNYAINGVIDTARPVLQNLESLGTNCGAWVNYDIYNGLWSFVINEAAGAAHIFNDSNIIGNINVSGKGITELYNKVKVSYPNSDLNDNIDYVVLEIPPEDFYPNEVENVLEIQLQQTSNQVTAQALGLVELKQSRVDKIIEFKSDYSMLGVKAGDVISVTAEMYGYDEKLFRVVTLAEDDADDNNIVLSITALEYDPDVYSLLNINRYQRDRNNGIKTFNTNPPLVNNNNTSSGNQITNALSTAGNTGFQNTFSTGLTQNTRIPGLYQNQLILDVATVDTAFEAFAAGGGHTMSNSYVIGTGFQLVHADTNIAAEPFKSLTIALEVPYGTIHYTIGSTPITLSSYYPCFLDIYYSATPYGTVAGVINNAYLVTRIRADLQTQNITWTVPFPLPGWWYFLINPTDTADLNYGGIIITQYDTEAQGSGGGLTLTGTAYE